MRFLPWVLLAGCIEYKPSASLDHSAATVSDTTPTAPDTTVPDDIPEGYALETFNIPLASSIDVIVFGDTSSSMSEELTTLGETITPFVERLAQTVDDWQLASVNGDDGCAVDGILLPTMSDFASTFANSIVSEPNDNDTDEMGLQTMAIAVEASGASDCNEGLVRGGLLHLIFVTDENDESPDFDTSPDYWLEYWNRIVAVHGDADLITISAVAGPPPDGCDGAEPGFGYDLAVANTGGEFLSICDDWAASIDLLADAGVVRDTYVLAQTPVSASIVVWVDGVEIPSAGRWHYDPGSNAVIFDNAPPAAGATVDILYQIAP